MGTQAQISIDPSSLPDATVGGAYSQTFTASGGLGTYVWRCDSTLPDGLWFDMSSATLNGTPTSAGSCSFTLSVSDDDGNTWTSFSCSIAINPSAPFPLTIGGSLTGGVIGGEYSQTLFVSGGAGGNYWQVSGGGLPDGLSLDAYSGTISGTPTTAGSWSFTVTVTDVAFASASADYQITIYNPPSIDGTLPDGMVNMPYSQTLSVSGGSGSYSWTLSGQPGGLQVDAGGTINGTPTTAGTFYFTVTVTDLQSGGSAQAAYGMSIVVAPISVSNVSASAGLTDATISFTVTLPYGGDSCEADIYVGGTWYGSGSPDGNGQVVVPISGLQPNQSYSFAIQTSANVPGLGSCSVWDGAGGFQTGVDSVVEFSAATYQANESDGSATITINRSGNCFSTASVDYSGNGSGTVTFNPGETSKTFAVPITDDGVFTGDSTFTLVLSNAQGGAVVGSQSVAVLTIVENDPPPPPPREQPSVPSDPSPTVTMWDLRVDAISPISATISWAVSVSGEHDYWMWDEGAWTWYWIGSETWTAVPDNNTIDYTSANGSSNTSGIYDSTTGRVTVTLTGLSPGCTYSFNAASSYAGVSASEDGSPFTTPDFRITGSPTVGGVTSDNATVTWQVANNTGQSVHHVVYYNGSSGDAGQVEADTDANTSAVSVTLSGLRPACGYTYWVESGLANSSYTVTDNAQGGNYTFSTAAPTLFTLANAHVENVAPTSIDIVWDVDPGQSCYSGVHTVTYSDTDPNGLQNQTVSVNVGSEGVGQARLSLSNLQPGHAYTCSLQTVLQVLISFPWGPWWGDVSATGSLEAATLGLHIIGSPAVSSVGADSATVTWTVQNDMGDETSHTVYYWLHGTDGILSPLSASAGSDPGSGQVIVPLSTLQAGQTYDYYVQSSNAVSSANAPPGSFCQFDTKPWVRITGDPARGVVDVATRSTTLNWGIENNSGQLVVNTIAYTWSGPTGSGYGQVVVTNAPDQSLASVTIDNLQADTTYTFTASSFVAGHEGDTVYTSSVVNCTFTVTAQELPLLPISIFNVTNVTADTLALVTWNVIKADTNAVASHFVITSTDVPITDSSPVVLTEGIEDNGQVMALLEGLTPETGYCFYVQSVVGFADGYHVTDNNAGSFYSLTTLAATNAISVMTNYVAILSVSNLVSGADALITWSVDYPEDQWASHFVLWNADTPPTPDSFLVMPGAEYDMGQVAALLTDLPLGRTNYFAVQSAINFGPSSYATDDNGGAFYSFVTPASTNGAVVIAWPTGGGATTAGGSPPLYDVALDPEADPDGDNLPNWLEWYYGTDPFSQDSDGDWLSDYDEVHGTSNPNHYVVTDPTRKDSDNDGLNDYVEVWVTYTLPNDSTDYYTNPWNPDTDGDGIPDSSWDLNPTDPADAASNTIYGLTYLEVYKNRSDAFVYYDFLFNAGFEENDPYNYSITNIGPAEVTLSWNGDGQWGSGNTNAESGIIAIGYDIVDGENTRHFTVEEWKAFCEEHNFPFSPDAPTWSSYSGAANNWIVMKPATCDGYQFSFTSPSEDVDNATVASWNASWNAFATAPQSPADSSVFLWPPEALGTNWNENFGYDQTASWSVYVGRFNILTDFNRDGAIDDKDEELAAEGTVFRFWYNDDDASGDTQGTDVPKGQGQGNGADNVINGTRDLVNFFPVWIDLRDVIMLPDYDKFEVWVTGNCNIVLDTGIEPDKCMDYLKDVSKARSVVTNAVIRLGDQDENNNYQYCLANSQWSGGGVFMLAEATNTTASLGVEVGYRDDNDDYHNLAYKSLNLSISSVEGMFRHKDLRRACGDTSGEPDRLGPPLNYPEEETTNKNFVFVHGYSVNSQQSRGWEAEIFKRMFWSGSRARFYGVDWFGSDSQIPGPVPFIGGATPNYHVNVIHAFDTAEMFRTFLNTLRGETTVAAHSLGNVVVSAAIHDCQARPSKYFMIDAAMPKEALGDIVEDRDMVHLAWDIYSLRLRASEWHTLFDVGDPRSMLTWRNRLSKVRDVTVYNYYSSGEDVLGVHGHDADPDHTIMILLEHLITSEDLPAWALQEKIKGRKFANGLGGSNYGGWGFNQHYRLWFVRPDQDVVNALEDETLRQRPVFKPGDRRLQPLYNRHDGTPDPTVAAFVQENRARLLAQMMPATTLAVGGNKIGAEYVENNINMNAKCKTGWPKERLDDNPLGPWKHSDLKNVAYPYVHTLFDEVVTNGGLK